MKDAVLLVWKMVGDDRAIHVRRRLRRLNGYGGGAIAALTLGSVWESGKALLPVLGLQLLGFGFNLGLTRWRHGSLAARARQVRFAGNVLLALLVGWCSGWALPVWLWLPFVAIAGDHAERHSTRWFLVALAFVMDVAAVASGGGFFVPLGFTALAFFCFEGHTVRYDSVHDMLAESTRDKKGLECAHALLREAHERLTVEVKAREAMELELQQAQRLEAVGRIAAGIAHEINTPVQFVNDSVHFLRDASNDLVDVLQKFQALRAAVVRGAPHQQELQAVETAEEAADLPYLFENMPKAFDRVLDGMDRVSTIVRSMKEFAHPDSREMISADLNRAIESTLVIARNEYKYIADLEIDFDDLPPVRCHIGDVNQAVLNIVVNAAHAIGDMVAGTDAKGRIRVSTRRDGDEVVIAIGDTGGGIPDTVREHIFDPFFTTKGVGKGTGQGLSIARSVVVDKHGGQLTFQSTVGQGTTFFVRLPINLETRPSLGPGGRIERRSLSVPAVAAA